MKKILLMSALVAASSLYAQNTEDKVKAEENSADKVVCQSCSAKKKCAKAKKCEEAKKCAKAKKCEKAKKCAKGKKKSKKAVEFISEEQAIEKALARAELTRENVRDLKCERDNEDGIVVYEVEFESGKYDYEYDIDAKSGKILKSKKEID